MNKKNNCSLNLNNKGTQKILLPEYSKINKIELNENTNIKPEHIINGFLRISSSSGSFTLNMPSVSELINLLGGEQKILSGQVIKFHLHNEGEYQTLNIPSGINLKGLNTILPTSLYQYWFVIKNKSEIDLYVVSRNDY